MVEQLSDGERGYILWWWWWGGRWVKEGVQGQEVVGGISDIPSCASAAVLVVAAAGLVCCRPTIGQRGIELGGAMQMRSNPGRITLRRTARRF